LENGLSPELKRSGDFFADIGQILLKEEPTPVKTQVVLK
jgi:hypothetical protein